MSEEVKAPRPPKRVPKKKVCTFCVEHADDIDYKDAAKLRRFTTEKGKILPRRMSGVCVGDRDQEGKSYGSAPLQSRLKRAILRDTASDALPRLLTYKEYATHPRQGIFLV